MELCGRLIAVFNPSPGRWIIDEKPTKKVTQNEIKFASTERRADADGIANPNTLWVGITNPDQRERMWIIDERLQIQAGGPGDTKSSETVLLTNVFK